MKKVLLLMLLLSLALLPVFAEEKPEEPEIEVDPDTTLVIWADELRAPLIEALGVEFTKTYGVGVTVQQLGFGDIRDNIKVAGPAGEGGDILVGAHDWLGELVTSGVTQLNQSVDRLLKAGAERFGPVRQIREEVIPVLEKVSGVAFDEERLRERLQRSAALPGKAC